MRRTLGWSTLATVMLLSACSDGGNGTAGPMAPEDSPSPAPSADLLARSAQETGVVPGRVLVHFRSGAPIANLVSAQGASVERTLTAGTRVLSVPVGSEQAVAEALARSPLVAFAEPDVLYTLDVPCGTGTCATTTDDFFGYRWDLHNDGTITDETGVDLAPSGSPDADMDWLELFDALGTVPGSAVIGIIDSGILATHEDLAGKVVAGYDFFNGDPNPADDHGHGTHVAGIAAGRGNNGTGVPGVAWIDQVELAAAKVCGYLYGFLHGCPSSAIADGIMWATDNGADVLNISLGGPSSSAAVQNALQYARQNGVLPLCAAGNDGAAVSFPAAFPECVAVSSTNWSDELASYSNFGPEVQLAAPGGDFGDPDSYGFILSTYNSGDDGYAWLAGTSMASPQVAGLAGLLHALGVTDDDDKLQRMRATANDLGDPGDDPLFGAGRINVYRAVADLIGAPINQAPTASFSSICDELSCDFVDRSTDGEGDVVSWSWDFGDGATSTAQSPSHSFAVPGSYTVTLTVTDNEGASGSTDQVLTVPMPNQPPTAAFTSSCSAYTCVFTDASVDVDGSVASWSWDFGDGGSSSEQNPTHTYGSVGTYTVTLTVVDDDGDSGTVSGTATAAEPNDAPSASFTFSCTDLTCSFVDQSTDGDGTLTTYLWNFGDGWTTNQPSPEHVYQAAGTYAVTLQVTDDDGATGEATVQVSVFAPGEAPSASFTVRCADLACDFLDTSTDAQGSVVSWSWDFGDGTGSDQQHPSREYDAPGSYDVTLAATDDVGATGLFTRSISVPSDNQAPTAAFTASCSGLDCAFTDASADGDGQVASWAWDFGDGSTSSEADPTHGYAAGGSYTVTLTAMDDDGASDSVQETVTVVVPNQAPTASFTSSCAELTCSFVNTSSDADGTLSSYLWTFGDGWSTNQESPAHTYEDPGVYQVALIAVDDDAARDTVTADVTVYAPGEAPTASFTARCTELTCDFTDASSTQQGQLVSWSWDFGGRGVSVEQHPSFTFAVEGTYSVVLTVTNDGGASDTFQRSVTVPEQNQAPTASFTSSCTALTCTFSDESTDGDGSVASWWWDFGDGASSTEQNPGHDYATAGSYAVVLVATDDQGAADTVAATITALEPNDAPTASFTWSCDGLTCDFVDQSVDGDGSITTYLWDFGDGWSANASGPQHVYATPGLYTVSLTVHDDDGASGTYNEEIAVGEAPVASFSVECVDLECGFTDLSTDGDGSVVFWEWDFGDGGTSFAQHPTHLYAEAGTYTVTLTVSDDDGAMDAVSQVITPEASANLPPTASFTSSCSALACEFSDTSGDPDGTVTSWSWTLGDGGTSSDRNPSHSYAASGSYTVTLTVTDDDGATDVSEETVTVTAPPEISLAAQGYKVRGVHTVDLSWSGASSADVDVYRDGLLIVTTTNDGAVTDTIGARGSGSYSYLICEAGTSVCSGAVNVVF